jgi:trehalose-6-phosphate synthase
MGLDYEFRQGGYLGINFHGRTVMIRVSHIGLDESFISEIMKSKSYRKLVNSFKAYVKTLTLDNKDVQIMTSIDTFHPISGLKNKLLAFLEFLRKYPSYRNKIILIQYVTPILCGGRFADKYEEDYIEDICILKEMRNEVLDIISKIQEEFGQSCIIY